LFPLLRGWLLLSIPIVAELPHGFLVPIVLALLRSELILRLLPVTLELLNLLLKLLDLLLEPLLVGLELLNLLLELLWVELRLVGLELRSCKLRALRSATLTSILLSMHSLSGETATLVKRLPLLVAARCAARWASLRVPLVPGSWSLLRSWLSLLCARGNGSCEYRQCDGCDSGIHCSASCRFIPHLRI